MGQLENYSLTEISITAVAVIGACGSFLAILENSRCKRINLCFGIFKCDRVLPDADAVEMEEFPEEPDIERPAP